MTVPILYNVPLALVDAYQGSQLVVRSRDAEKIVAALSTTDCENVAYVQILGLGSAIDGLLHWACQTPVDLVVEKPEDELPLLYRYSPLLADRPVRVSVPLAPGFGKVVKLALSLDFAVKLEGSQPTPALGEELLMVASDYLHRSSVSVPVEFIHSLFLAFFRQEPVSLWAVQEEDPRQVRFISDQGEETIAKRFIGMVPAADFNGFLTAQLAGLIAERRECCDCEFVDRCAGYFKWPDKDYRCDGVKALFRMLAAAAQELRSDLAGCPATGTAAT